VRKFQKSLNISFVVGEYNLNNYLFTMSQSLPHISLSSRHLAAVGYIPLIGIIILLRYRQKKFIVKHAATGTLLSIYFFAAYFLLPTLGIFLALIFAALAASGFIQASAGRKFEIPLVSNFVEWVVRSSDPKGRPPRLGHPNKTL
jgi:uncharacterized membrane protein